MIPRERPSKAAESNSKDLQKMFDKQTLQKHNTPSDIIKAALVAVTNPAAAVSSEYSQFVHKYPQLAKYEMSISDWQLIHTTLAFLSPFREVSKRYEGDYITVDKVQESMDFLVHHYEHQRAIHTADPVLSHALHTS